jgi:hypothetical protein
MDADRLPLVASQPPRPSLTQPEGLATDAESEHEASLEWFESRLRSYTERIVSDMTAEQRDACDDLESVTELSPCG